MYIVLMISNKNSSYKKASLPDQIRSTVKTFTDDTKIFRALHEPEVYTYLQDDLDRLVEWSQLWPLHFNDSKCKVLHMGNSNPSHSYTMSNIPLTRTAEEKDLGMALNDTAYKWWSCHSGFKLLCKVCRTSPNPAMGARFTVFGHAGHADPRMAGAVAHKNG